MLNTIPSEVVASIFLKYLTLQPVSLLFGNDNGDQEIKLWVCPEHGTPSMGSGPQDCVPLDLPVACIFISKNSMISDAANITKVTVNPDLDQLLFVLSKQMQAQMHSFDVSKNRKALEVLPQLIESDSDVDSIAQTFFKPSTQKGMH